MVSTRSCPFLVPLCVKIKELCECIIENSSGVILKRVM